MKDQPPAADPDPAEDTAAVTSVTGVATGALGTSTALDETQVYGADDLIEEAAVEDLPQPISNLTAPATRTPVRLVAMPPDAAAPTRRARGNPIVGVAAVVAAAALVVLAASSLLADRGGGGGLGGQTLPTSDPGASLASTAPVESPGSSGRGNGNGNGNGNGKGNGNKPTHKP